MITEGQLPIAANLTINIDDYELVVRGSGSSVVVEIPSVSLMFQLMRELGSIRVLRDRIAGLATLLKKLGLTLVVRTRRRKLFTIGCDGNSWILKWFGVANAEFHLS